MNVPVTNEPSGAAEAVATMQPLVGLDVLPRRADAEAAEPVQEMPADIEVVEPEPEPNPSEKPAETPAGAHEVQDAPDAREAEDDELDEPEEPAAARPAAPRQPGVALAVVATIIITLGLAALVVYAYLHSPEAGVL